MSAKNIDLKVEGREKKTPVATTDHSPYHGLVVSSICTSAEPDAAIAGSIIYYDPNENKITLK